MKPSNSLNKLFSILSVSAAISLIFCPLSSVKAYEPEDFFELSLEKLMNIDITSVSKSLEKISDAASAVFVLTQNDIRASGLTSIPELLRLVPGVQVARIDSNKWAITARGFGQQFSNKLLVLRDGRSLYTPFFSGVYWETHDIPLHDIERIEIIRGPGAGLWGANAVNGVINIISKKAKDTQGSIVSTGYGSIDRGVVTARNGGKIGEKGHYRSYVSYFNSTDLDKASDGTTNNDDWNLSKAGFRTDLSIDHNSDVTIQGDVYDGKKTGDVQIPSISAPFLLPPSTVEETFTGGNILSRYKKSLSNKQDFTAQSYIDYTKRDNPFVEREIFTFDIEAQHVFNFGDSDRIIWGGGYRHIADSNTGSAFIPTNNNGSDRNNIYNGFIEEKHTFIPNKLFLTIGAKLEHHDSSGFEFQPRIRSTYKFSKKQSAWFSIAKASRTPTRVERDLGIVQGIVPPTTATGTASFIEALGTENVNAEELTSYELGYRAEPNEDISIDIAVFYTQYRDLITERDLGTPFERTDFGITRTIVPAFRDNGGEANTYGAELYTDWRINNFWKVAGSYSYLNVNTTTDSGFQTTTLANQEGNSAKNIFNFRSHLKLTDTIVMDNSIYYVDNIPSYQTDSYIRFDTHLGWKLSDNIELDLTGYNLFDDKHTEFGSVFLTETSEIPRSVFGKATVTF